LQATKLLQLSSWIFSAQAELEQPNHCVKEQNTEYRIMRASIPQGRGASRFVYLCKRVQTC